MNIDEKKIERIEIRDESGRAYSIWDIEINQVSYLEGSKELRIFVNRRKNEKI